ncbi:hypothetical protein LCGC14_1701780 [marine sediment metagenome]|uniref:Uncharacterized protein n=1 Tax=marine sediment metagenome TaxID=412755 RepID=A0A0F9HI84_9ZZZZ
MTKKPKIDKRKLWGKFDRSQSLHHKLHRLVVAKGNDIPWTEEGVSIHNANGINGWQLMGILGVAAVFGMLLWKPLQITPNAAPPPATTQTAPPMEAQKYRVSFWGEDGEEIKVDRSQGGSE